MPKMSVVTFSLHLRIHLLTTGRYITAFPSSVLRLNEKRFSLKALPVEMPAPPVANRHRDPQKPYLEPGGRGIQRECSRLREIEPSRNAKLPFRVMNRGSSTSESGRSSAPQLKVSTATTVKYQANA